jgi:alpha-ketoglutarate-dependent taurine dioxygenase
MANATQGVAAATAVSAWPGPLVVQPDGTANLETYARESRDWIDRALLEHGALLFRGFNVESPAAFGAVAAALSDRLLDYVYRSTPRKTMADNVYTATEYPPDASIPMHNENAYQRDWPMRLMFCCLQPASVGGATPLARSANVTRRIDDTVKQAFMDRRVMYVRNYGMGVDLSWETTFQTTSRADVEAFCQHEGIECEWLPDDRLRTRQVCQAMARHPITHEEFWFNQAHLFHVSSLGAEGQSAMLDVFAEEDLPRNAYFGDGGRIDEEMLEHIRRAYEAEKLAFAWQRGDVLLADNMLVSHGRMPFQGTRQVLAAMARPFSSC